MVRFFALANEHHPRAETKINLLLALPVAVALISIARPAHGETVSTMFIDNDGSFTSIVSPSGTVNTAQGINSSGQVTGYGSVNGSGGFVYSGGTYNYLSDPAAAPNETLANAINNSGQVVGSYFTSASVANGPYGFLFSGGSYTAINDPLAATNTIFGTVAGGTSPMGINNAGQIVGYYRNAPGQTFGFLYNKGSYTTLNYPGATYTAAYDINNLGVVLGAFSAPNMPTQLFLYDNGVYLALSLSYSIGLYGYRAYGLNDLGDIVGTTGKDGFVYNFLTGYSQIIDYNGGPGYTPLFTSLSDITDSGLIVGNAAGFVTPLPGGLPLFASALCALGLLGWHKKRKRIDNRPSETISLLLH